MVGEPVGRPVQLLVCQLVVLAQERYGVGCLLRLGREQLVHAGVTGAVRGRGEVDDEALGALHRVEL
jgi:hypothetical protein